MGTEIRICYASGHVRRLLRASISLFLAALTVVEATPVLAVASPRPLRSPVCELRSASEPVSLVAVPAGRNAAAPDASLGQHAPFVRLALPAPVPAAVAGTICIQKHRREPASDAWVRLHRHRARAPDDADPL